MNLTADPQPPPALKPGDTIGICAPAGPANDRRAAEAGLRLLSEAGFKLRLQTGLLERRCGYLAGADQQRAAELHELWRDPEVKALLALRGGYGCLRLLELLDWELLTGLPKMLIGFSDLTVLHAARQRRSPAAVTFHGPMLCTLAAGDRESILHFFAVLQGRQPESLAPAGLEILRPGQTRGRLTGGNLTCLSHLLATPWEPLWQDAILLLEDVGEAPYRLDRALSHLALAGRLEQVAGIILGEFNDCGDQEAIWQRVLELTARRRPPVWANFPAGHGRRNFTLPLGAPVLMDSANAILNLRSGLS